MRSAERGNDLGDSVAVADNEHRLAWMFQHGSGNINGILLSVPRGYRYHFWSHP